MSLKCHGARGRGSGSGAVAMVEPQLGHEPSSPIDGGDQNFEQCSHHGTAAGYVPAAGAPEPVQARRTARIAVSSVIGVVAKSSAASTSVLHRTLTSAP